MAPKDAIIRVGDSRLQHGPLSGRVYCMRLGPGDGPEVTRAMLRLAKENGYTKLFAKIPEQAAAPFLDQGYTTEARIPDFYKNGDAALFASKFLSRDRARPADSKRIKNVIDAARAKAGEEPGAPNGFALRELGKDDAPHMAALYSEVFATYPFPIFDPGYLARTMDENFRYFGAEIHGELAAVSSSEMDGECVEMTDFATLPGHRGAGLAGHLLTRMEHAMGEAGIKTAFTIARARSFGINILFSRARYAFAGTLVNNTGISGRLESMNVWYKPLNR